MAVTLHANNAYGFLASPVAPGDTSIVLQLGQGVLFPAITVDEQFYITVENRAVVGALEIMLVTARAVDSFTVVRAQQGTAAQSFAAGTSVSNRVTAEFLNNIDGRIVEASEVSEAAAIAAASAVVAADAATIAVALKANVDSQTFTGVPAAPTAAPGTNTTQLATTAFVGAAVAAGGGGGGGGAPVDSPAFTGNPTAPTPAAADNDTSIATTAFVTTALASAGFAPIANPVFTGVQTGTTASQGTNTTRLATTAFVVAANALQANLAGPTTFTGSINVPNVTYPNNSTLAANTAYVTAAIAGIVPSLDTEGVQDVVGGMVVGGTQTNITVTYNDTTGKLDFVAAAGGGGGGDVTGPAGSVADAPAIFNGTTGKVIKQTTYALFKTSLAITKADLALGNVDNTSDVNKPVSTAQAAAIAARGDVFGPASSTNDAPALFSGTTGKLVKQTTYPAFKASLGLASVDDTSDVNKPVSTATQTALNTKGDVFGPASSTNDAPALFSGTTGKLVKQTTYPAFKTSLALTKADVGLSTVDNSSDALKPVSTAQQAALDLKANLIGPTTFSGTTSAATPTAGDNTTKVATTAFVTGAISTQAATTTAALALKANLASPVLSGTPTAPTAAPGSNDLTIANTEFVTTLVGAGGGGDVLTQILALDVTDSTAAATALLEGVSSPDGLIGFVGGVLINQPFLPAPGVTDRTLMYDSAGAVKLATHTEAKAAYFGALTGGLYSTAGVITTFLPWGKNSLWVPAGSMDARLTNGADRSDYGSLLFATGSDEFAVFEHWLPKAYNGSTLTAQFVWKHPATTSTYSVTWAIQGVCVNDDIQYGSSYGTAVTVTDEGGTTDDVYYSPATAAITLGGTPAKERFVRFQVYRDVDGNGTAANDDLAVDAQLLGIILSITTNAATDD